jgi:hypothetical protein
MFTWAGPFALSAIIGGAFDRSTGTEPFRPFITLAVAYFGSRPEAAPQVVGLIAQRGSLTMAPARRRIFWRMRSARSSSLIDMCRWIAVQ